MKKRVLGLIGIILIIGVTVIGCDTIAPGDKEIDSQFLGKWKLESFVSEGITYTLPCSFMGIQMDTAGYEITSTSYKSYLNGVLVENHTDAYSDGNLFYQSDGTLISFWVVIGENASVYTDRGIESVKKVLSFIW
jgi:hypothetical protein